MKRPQPDISDVLRNEFLGNTASVRKLKRHWGTTTIGGVEVFTPRQYYHTASKRSDNFEELFKFLGAYDDVTGQDYAGVRDAWLYLNKNKGTDLGIDFNTFVSDNLNKMWWDDTDGVRPEGLTLTTSVVIDITNNNSVERARIDEIINPEMLKEVAIQSVIDNYEELWDLCSITHEGVGVINKGSITDSVNQVEVPDEDDLTPDDPWLATAARYALRDHGIFCTVKDLAIGTISRGTGGIASRLMYQTTYVLDIEIPYNPFNAGEVVVQSIASDLSYDYARSKGSNGYTTKQALQSMDSTDLEDDADLVTRSYILWEDVSTEADGLYSSLWFLYQPTEYHRPTYYLRAAPFNDPRAFGLTYKQLNQYTLQLLDSGYRKKKVPWWKKAIAVVLVVIAIIVFIVPGLQGAGYTLLSLAKAILLISLTLTLAMAALAVMGMSEWASAFGMISKWIEPLTLVATIFLIYTGVSNAIEAAKKAAEEAAKASGKELVTQSTLDLVVDMVEDKLDSLVEDFVEGIVKGASDMAAGDVLSNAALSFSNNLAKIVNFALNLRLESLHDKNKDLKAAYDEMQEEMARETDSLQGFMRIYAKPATADWSIFSSQFDLPYERGGGILAMGNIQRTTKQATRKASYDDPAFDSILII